MRRAFITGGTGFIGRHVVAKLLETSEIELTILTRQNLPDQHRVTFIQGDLDDWKLLQRYMAGCDYVFHLAGCKKDSKHFVPTNIDGTNNILTACKVAFVKKLLYLSSVGVIGETPDMMITERSPCRPVNEYEKSKHVAEQAVLAFAKLFKGETYILRPSNVFGELDPELHLLNLMRKIAANRFMFVGSDSSRYYLNYVYVKEISEVAFLMMERGTGGGTYIINTPTSLPEFIGVIQELIGNLTPFRHLPYWPLKLTAKIFDLVPKKILDPPPINSLKLQELTCRKIYQPEALIREAGWQPKYPIRDALKNLVLHYKDVGLL